MSSAIKAHLAIFASGGGSNADKICTYFASHPDITVELIITNKVNAGVLDVAAKHHKHAVVIPKKSWSHEDLVLPHLTEYQITHIILAGFLLLIPEYLIQRFPEHIINIHPALLPKYGGKGMYGHHVHTAVKEAQDSFSGITIHRVDEHYDEGDILFQKKIAINLTDTIDEIAAKVLKIEHHYYARVIERWISGQPMDDLD